MIRVLIVEDQRMAWKIWKIISSPVGDIVWRLLSQTQLWQKPYADRAGVNLS